MTGRFFGNLAHSLTSQSGNHPKSKAAAKRSETRRTTYFVRRVLAFPKRKLNLDRRSPATAWFAGVRLSNDPSFPPAAFPAPPA
jgi:hypothetical protein